MVCVCDGVCDGVCVRRCQSICDDECICDRDRLGERLVRSVVHLSHGCVKVRLVMGR
jgi:hypothetical protein